jgi:hypothetical protein
MEVRKHISRTKDILKKVADDFGVEYEVVESLYKCQLDYMQTLIKKDDVLSIKFPYLGTMYLKEGFVRTKMEMIEKGKYSKNDRGRNTIMKLKRKLKLIKKASCDTFSLHKTAALILDYRYNLTYTMEEKENIQNTQWT